MNTEAMQGTIHFIANVLVVIYWANIALALYFLIHALGFWCWRKDFEKQERWKGEWRYCLKRGLIALLVGVIGLLTIPLLASHMMGKPYHF